MNEEQRKAVLGEVLMDELKAIREYVEDIPEIKNDVSKLKDDMAEVKSDVKVIKAVVKNHSKRLDEHDIAIRRLKHKIA